MRKGDFTIKILEGLAKVTVDTAIGAFELLDVITMPYGGSPDRILGKIENLFEGSDDLKTDRKQRYYNMLYKLKKEGFIAENNKKISITAKGKKYLKILKDKKTNLPATSSYKKEKISNFIIVIFDIPERERKKRDWIRSVLNNLDFKMVQKSVWIGKTKISKDFLADLEQFKIIDFVEIFEITKTGSLDKLT